MRRRENHYQHLVRGLPNHWYTHILVRWINRAMRRSDSKWKIICRYRGPKPGTGRYSMSLRRDQARRLSLYLVETDRSKAAARRLFERQRFQREQTQRVREIRERREAAGIPGGVHRDMNREAQDAARRFAVDDPNPALPTYEAH